VPAIKTHSTEPPIESASETHIEPSAAAPEQAVESKVVEKGPELAPDVVVNVPREPEYHKPPNPEELQHSLNVAQVDITKRVHSESLDYSDETIRQETIKRGFTGLIKKIWYGNIAHDYLRQRNFFRGEQKIVTEKNVLALVGGIKADHDREMAAILKRFVTEGEGLLHQGEKKQAAEGDYADSLRTAITKFAAGELSYDALVEEKTRIVDQYGRRQHAQDRNRGLLYADNIIDVALNAKAAFEHGIGLATIDAALNFSVGEARSGVRTEASREITDRVVDRLYKTRLGSAVNETTLGLGVAVLMAGSKFTSRKLVVAAGATIGLGVGTGLVGGLRESQRVKQERRLHSRQMAEGSTIITDQNSRRQKMETTRYATVESSVLLDQINSALPEQGQVTNNDSYSRLLDAVTEAQTRIYLSDSDKIGYDLISYSSKLSIEQSRTELDIALANARDALQNFIDNSDDSTLTELGIKRGNIGDIIEQHQQSLVEMIETDIAEKDRAFANIRRNRILAATAIGATVGIVLGSASQELHAAFDHSIQGIFDHQQPGQNRQTELAALFHSTELKPGLHPNANYGNSAFKFGQNALDLPPGYHVAHTATGALELIGLDNKVIAGHIGFDQNGHLNAATTQLLERQGFGLHLTNEVYASSHSVTETAHVSTGNYIQSHQGEFTTVHRQLWYNNNTPYSDKNELATWWGGENYSGIDAHGNFVLNVSHMTTGGSYEGNQSANYLQLLHEGKLGLAVSLDENTQNHVIMLHFNADGNVIIDAHNAALRSVFENQNGHAVFIGGYAEVVQIMGKDSNGSTGIRMLGTLVGGNHPKIITETLHTVIHSQGEHVITHIEAPAVASSLPIEIAPAIPVYGRRGMEDIRSRLNLTNPNVMPSYYGGRSLAELQDWIKKDPDRLMERQREIQPDGSVKWVEADGSPVVRDVARERETIQRYLEEQDKDNPAHFQLAQKVAETFAPMTDETRISVNIPAWMEGKILYHTLEEYAKQTDRHGAPLALNSYEINILVNRKTGTEPDNSIAVIKEFIKDYQDKNNGLKPNINFYDVELDPPFNNVGYARKLLTDAVMIRNQQRTNQAQPLYIESEDADLTHVDPYTVVNLINTLDEHPYLDAAGGVQDRSPEYLKDNDYLFLRRRIWDFFVVLARNKKFRDPTSPSWNYTWNRFVTGGWNTGYSAEAYAQIGGYDVMETGEDMILGEKMTMVRGNGTLPNLEVTGTLHTRTDSSPRRFIHEIFSGDPAYGDKFTDEATNGTIRNNTIEQLMDIIADFSRVNPENQSAFEGALSGIFSSIRSVTHTQTEANQLMRRLLFFLGLKKTDYNITDDGTLSVSSWKNFSNALEKYRLQHVA
jgi:hypothetical protein